MFPPQWERGSLVHLYAQCYQEQLRGDVDRATAAAGTKAAATPAAAAYVECRPPPGAGASQAAQHQSKAAAGASVSSAAVSAAGPACTTLAEEPLPNSTVASKVRACSACSACCPLLTVRQAGQGSHVHRPNTAPAWWLWRWQPQLISSARDPCWPPSTSQRNECGQALLFSAGELATRPGQAATPLQAAHLSLSAVATVSLQSSACLGRRAALTCPALPPPLPPAQTLYRHAPTPPVTGSPLAVVGCQAPHAQGAAHGRADANRRHPCFCASCAGCGRGSQWACQC